MVLVYGTKMILILLSLYWDSHVGFHSDLIPVCACTISVNLILRFSEFKSQKRHLRPTRSELDNYLEEALVELDEENFDILQWWKRNSDLYPTLAKMARDFLAVQVSTVASESAFSAAGRLTDHLRNSMTAETIEALVCSKDWFGSIDGGFDLNQFRPFM